MLSFFINFICLVIIYIKCFATTTSTAADIILWRIIMITVITFLFLTIIINYCI